MEDVEEEESKNVRRREDGDTYLVFGVVSSKVTHTEYDGMPRATLYLMWLVRVAFKLQVTDRARLGSSVPYVSRLFLPALSGSVTATMRLE